MSMVSDLRSQDTDLDETRQQNPDQRPRIAPRTATRPEAPEIGMQLGRYVVLSQLGAGTAGAVFSAYDPALDRRVAIKLLRKRRAATEHARTRLQREAQALAKLEHPNIVTVYDVGMHQGQLFLAMEQVEGRTLSEWLYEPGATQRPWREVLAVYEAAALGLAASHELGLVHRDFKPENVMLGFDGRVRVMDFGLVTFRGEDSTDPQYEASNSGVFDDSQTRLTRSGALVGTPAYMSPEQFEREEITARSDQFAWCVALFEALYGVRPFKGRTIDALREAVLEGQIRATPRRKVPAWLHQIILRGLARDPAQRYASMQALLEALRAGERTRRWWMRAVAGLALAAGLGAAYGTHRLEQTQLLASCEQRAAQIEQVWSPELGAALEARLRAAELPEATQLVERLSPWLERQAEDWRIYAKSACVAAELEQRWSPERYEAARWCLQDRRFELEAIVAGVERASEGFVPDAVMAAAELPPVSLCTSTASAEVQALPVPQQREAIADMRRELSAVRYRLAAGEYEGALSDARDLRARAEALGWAPLSLAVRVQEATALERTDAFAAAEALASQTYVEAASAGIWDVAVTAASELVDIVGFDLARSQEGLLWATHARVAIARAGDPLGLREATLASSVGTLYNSDGQFELAREHYQRALELRVASLGPDHPAVGDIYFVLATVDEDDALAPDYIQRALAIYERSLGPEHPYVAAVLLQKGYTSEHSQDYETALAAMQRALSLQRASLGPTHLETAKTLASCSRLQLELGQLEAARAGYEEALPTIRSVLGQQHPLIAHRSMEYARVLERSGELGRAEELRARALEIYEATLPPEHQDLLSALSELAQVEHARGQSEAALRHARRAHEQSRNLEPRMRVPHALQLAEILWARSEQGSQDRERARTIVQEVSDQLTGTGRAGAEPLAACEQWLREHPEPRD